LNHLVPSSFVAYKEQLIALGTVPGEQDSFAKVLSDLRAELAKEMAARETSRIKVKTLTRALEGMKIMANKFAT
jgi:hypothetical protein